MEKLSYGEHPPHCRAWRAHTTLYPPAAAGTPTATPRKSVSRYYYITLQGGSGEGDPKLPPAENCCAGPGALHHAGSAHNTPFPLCLGHSKVPKTLYLKVVSLGCARRCLVQHLSHCLGHLHPTPQCLGSSPSLSTSNPAFCSWVPREALKCLGPCSPCGRPRWSSRHLALTRPSLA